MMVMRYAYAHSFIVNVLFADRHIGLHSELYGRRGDG